ncbi:peptidylprolyl isomerase [Streptomyces sp. HPF1205]|uniref:peptidylprolyl isomerase n=1 Tax=Streptomyces sp. HPF1205 TaxID=2873262 RepID=UPI001CECBD0D|nr:peptidylprolyl isomerase [Streptomyces sp. HPF1205]
MVTKEQRRRQLAREKFERQQQRRLEQRRKARVRNSVIAAVVAVAVAGTGAAFAAGAFKSDKKKSGDNAAATPSASTSPSASAGAKAPDPCAKPAKGAPGTQQWHSAPALSIDKSATYTFTLRTTCGTIPLTLDAAKAPQTVNSFAFLAGQGFFDHTKCHRLTTDHIYVLQCGDPKGDGSGGPGYTIPDENLSAFGKASADGKVVYPAGTVAMANTGAPHSGGSQFFLVYKDSRLAPSYTPFGTIGADGMKVLDKIAKAGENDSSGPGDGAPNATVVIDKATVTKS